MEIIRSGDVIWFIAAIFLLWNLLPTGRRMIQWQLKLLGREDEIRGVRRAQIVFALGGLYVVSSALVDIYWTG